MTTELFATLVRLLIAPLAVLARLAAMLLRLVLGVAKALLVVLVLSLLVAAVLQAGGVGIDPGPAEELVVPGSDDGVAPGDPNTSTHSFDDGDVNSTGIEREIHEQVNEHRTNRGLDPLAWDRTVASVSRAHSKDMADREYFSHTTPEGDGPHDRYREAGRGCSAYGENIAMSWAGQPVEVGGETTTYETDQEVAQGLVRQWMESPSHRENMLHDRWESGGVGVYVTDDGQVYATHNFCRGWVP